MPTLVLCAVCHDESRPLEHAYACKRCTMRIARDLEEIPRLLEAALTLSAYSVTPRPAWRLVGAELGAANRVPVLVWPSLPAGPTNPTSRVRISGSRTPPTPVSVELLNLVGPGAACVSDPYADQTGELPVHFWLSQITADWADLLGHAPPAGGVVALVDWLLPRWDMVCARADMAQFADELHRQVGILRHAAGVVAPRPELCDGVSCRRCHTRSLWRESGRVTCATCGTILEADEYEAWTQELTKLLRRTVTV